MAENKDYPSFPIPPEWVFKYNRSRTVPEKQILEQEQSMFVGAGAKFPSLFRWSDERLGTIGLKRDGEDILDAGGNKLLRPTEEEMEMGGQLRFFEGVPYPAKGWPFPPAFYGINGAKRITLNALRFLAGKDMIGVLIGFGLTPRKWKIKTITRAMHYYHESMMMFIEPFVLEDEFCTPFTRTLRKFITDFFVAFGVPFFAADLAAESFVMDLEYDDAYRFRAEDGMSATTKAKMMENPARELAVVFRTISERTHAEMGPEVRKGMVDKFNAASRVLRYAFYVPSVKRAFKSALNQCDFEKLQLDPGDAYHTLLWPDHQFQGMTQKARWERFQEIHKDGLPRRLVWRRRAPGEGAEVAEVKSVAGEVKAH